MAKKQNGYIQILKRKTDTSAQLSYQRYTTYIGKTTAVVYIQKETVTKKRWHCGTLHKEVGCHNFYGFWYQNPMLANFKDRHSAFSTNYSSILNCEIFRAFGKIILGKTKSRYTDITNKREIYSRFK